MGRSKRKIVNDKNMKIPKLIFIICCYILATIGVAVGQDRAAKKEEIQQAKMAFIAEKITLLPEQEQKFWPVYNDYTDRKKAIRKAIRLLKMVEFANATTDEALKADIDKMFGLKQEELNLEKEYYGKFLKILSARQTVELVKAERAFIKILYKKLEDE